MKANTWTKVRLADLARVKYGKANPKEPGVIPLIGSGGTFGGTSKALIDYPTLVIGRKGTAGMVWFQHEPCWPSDTTFYLEWLNGSVDHRFLYYCFHQNALSGQHARTTMPSLQRQDLEEYEVPLPCLSEQRAVARALETVQKANEARQRELALERERKAGLMEHLFTRGTRSEPTKRTAIGDIPESWRILSFADAVDVRSGQVDPRNEPYSLMEHVGPDNIEPVTGRLLPVTTAKELNLISGKYLFTDRDVLYSKIRPYLKKATSPRFTGICSADMYPLRPKEGVVLRDFLFHYLLTDGFTDRAISYQDRTGIPKINRQQLGIIPVPVPLLEEQEQIASTLSASDAKMAALQHEAQLLTELFEAMLEELMTGRLSAVPLIEEQQSK